mgnify:CR=1 FL=1
MNTRAKGNRIERKAVEHLEQQGYLVYRVRGSSNRFNISNDIFGLFDLLCCKSGETKLIQVKSSKKPNLSPFAEFKDKYSQFNVEVWVWKARKGFEIFSCG